jgi:hypothetical protein
MLRQKEATSLLPMLSAIRKIAEPRMVLLQVLADGAAAARTADTKHPAGFPNGTSPKW